MPRNDGNTEKKKNNYTKNQKGNLKRNFKENNNKRNKRQWRAPIVKADSGNTKPFIAKRPEDRYGDPYEYSMSRTCANDILKECPKNIKPQQYLCDFVTEQYGIMGYCQRVHIFEG